MAVTTPTTPEIIPQEQLATATLSVEPMKTIARRINSVWKHYTPALIDVAYLVGPSQTRDQTFEFAIAPSRDGLDYAFTHTAWVNGTSATLTIKVEEFNGTSWSTAYNVGAASTINAWNTRTHTTTLASDTERIRITYQHSTSSYYPAHVLAVPLPGNAPSTAQTSGYIPFDDGQLVATGAPIHGELLNRVKASCLAVLQGRQAMVLSLVQDTTAAYKPGYVSPSSGYGSPYMEAGRGVISLPGQKGESTIALHFRGYTSAGSGTRTCTVRQTNSKHPDSSVSFDVDGSWQTTNLKVRGELPEIQITVSNPDLTGTDTSVIESLVGYWTPGV